MALTDGLVAWYKFDETSGNASDSVWGFTLTNNNTCTYTDFILDTWVDTRKTGNWYLSIANDLWLNGSSQPWTVSMFVKPNWTISTQSVFASWSDWAQRIYNYIEWFSWACRLVRVRLWIAADVCSKTYTFSNATVYHICWRYNWTTLNLKINDWTATTLSSIGNWSWAAYTDNAVIGAYVWWWTNFNWGTALCWFWNRSITDAEVTELYNAWAGLQYPFTTATDNTNFLLFM